MIKIDFKGPFSYAYLSNFEMSSLNNIEKHSVVKKGSFVYDYFSFKELNEAKNPGIYIWGFMDENPENWNQYADYACKPFIPYYVGKSESSVYNRVKEHFNAIHSQGNTYCVLEPNAYKNLSDFLKCIKRNSQPYRSMAQDTHNIAYLNNTNFIEKKYGHQISKGTSSDKIDHLNNNSTLRNTINSVFAPDKLFVCFASLKNSDRKILDHAETAVKFCLKKNTISTSEISFAKLKESGFLFNITCTSDRRSAEYFEQIFHKKNFISKEKSSKIEFDSKDNIYFGYSHHDFGPMFKD